MHRPSSRRARFHDVLDRAVHTFFEGMGFVKKPTTEEKTQNEPKAFQFVRKRLRFGEKFFDSQFSFPQLAKHIHSLYTASPGPLRLLCTGRCALQSNRVQRKRPSAGYKNAKRSTRRLQKDPKPNFVLDSGHLLVANAS